MTFSPAMLSAFMPLLIPALGACLLPIAALDSDQASVKWIRAAMFFIALFVFAGANLHVHELVKYAPMAFALVAVRSLAKWGGVYATGSACRLPAEQSRSIGLLLIPMAGLAIGLVNTTQNLFPDTAATVSA